MAAPAAPANVRVERIGTSAEGRPIDAYSLGQGPAIIVIGDIHGAPEANTANLVWYLMQVFEDQPQAVPRDVSLVFVPVANPDGLADGTRELADGVDANRNWPTGDWTPDTFGPSGERIDGGGPSPLSEPETTALAAFIERTRPRVVLSYHSAGAIAMGGPHARASGLYDLFVDASGYYATDWLYYPVTGDFAQWLDDDLGVPTIEVELRDQRDPELERNLAGLQAIVQALDTSAAGDPPY